MYHNQDQSILLEHDTSCLNKDKSTKLSLVGIVTLDKVSVCCIIFVFNSLTACSIFLSIENVLAYYCAHETQQCIKDNLNWYHTSC